MLLVRIGVVPPTSNDSSGIALRWCDDGRALVASGDGGRPTMAAGFLCVDPKRGLCLIVPEIVKNELESCRIRQAKMRNCASSETIDWIGRKIACYVLRGRSMLSHVQVDLDASNRVKSLRDWETAAAGRPRVVR